MAPLFALFTIIFLEGYVVLSAELLAIRLLLPFTGSGTDTVSIIIAAVLLPLAFGYYAGGRFKPRSQNGRRVMTVRRRLIWNLIISAGFLTVGLSYTFLSWAFVEFQQVTGIHNRIILTAIYAGVFIVLPVFLLGQTVPLVSNYFSHRRLSEMAGRMLFFSTLGSFMGAVFGTLVLMTMLGVHHTVSITIGCMGVLVFILARRKISMPTVLVTLIVAVCLVINSDALLRKSGTLSNNLYNIVQVVDFKEKDLRAIKLNHTYGSIIYTDSPEPYVDYGIFVEDNFIAPIREDGPPRRILILGAGGFTIGRTDTKNKYTYVDIDKSLKDISEIYFLEEKLTANKEFVVMDARAYLLQSKEKFDLILVDLFRDPISVPDNLLTREFFQEAKDHLTDNGILLNNTWMSPNFSDAFSRNVDFTLHQVFPNLSRQIVRPFDAWRREDDWNNVLYVFINHPETGERHVYTDNKSTSIYDRPAIIHQPKNSKK